MKLKLLFTIIGIAVLIILFEAAWLYYFIQIGKGVVKRSQKFERINPNAEMRILVIGDSTAYGVGASSPEFSLAGLYGKRFPDAEVINLGVNGMKTDQLVTELTKIQDQRFDHIQVDIGGNDIIRFVDLDETKKNIHEALRLASTMAPNVIFVSTGNLGTVKLFPPGTRILLDKRTRKARAFFIEASKQYEEVTYVDFFREADEDPFAQDPAKHYSEDFLHPSDDGYADWWSYISPVVNNLYPEST